MASDIPKSSTVLNFGLTLMVTLTYNAAQIVIKQGSSENGFH